MAGNTTHKLDLSENEIIIDRSTIEWVQRACASNVKFQKFIQ